MSVNKEELFQKIDNLSNEQLQVVSDYVEKLSKKKGLNMEAFNYVIENYSETLKDLVDR